MVDDKMMDQMLEKLRQAVDIAVEKFVQEAIGALSMDKQWLEKIQTQIEQRMVERVLVSLNGLDIPLTFKNIMLENKDTILSTIKEDFSTAGISDLAQDKELTVMDGIVVIEHETVTHDLTVERNTHLKGDILIDGDLAVKGRINTDNKSWKDLGDHIGRVTYDHFKNEFRDEMINDMVSQIQQGIDIDSITVNGDPLIKGDELSDGIKTSGLTRVGRLKDLRTEGRLGVNTETPDSALSIWDEEVSISAGKISKDTGFIGTSRLQNLVIGVNRENHLEIDVSGLTTIQKLRIGKNLIGHGKVVPNYAGNKGDIVFNTDMTPDTPFAWICLGAFRWQALKSAK